MNFTTIRHRANRRAVALLAIFAIALSGTGLASLAVLQQTVSVAVTGTATTIDFRINNQRPTLAVDFDLVERGDIRYLPLHLTNDGTGYVSISTSPASPGGGTNPIATTNAADITVNTRLVAYADVPTADCNSVGAPVSDWGSQPLIGASPIFGGAGFTINAGAFKDICLVFQVGGDASLGAVAANGTNFDAYWQLKGFYP